jgi:hypothetical protein
MKSISPTLLGAARMWHFSMLLLLLPLAALAGCRPDDGMAEVSGTVTVDGAPAESGAMAFFPVSGKGSPSGAPIKEGRYSARVLPGQAKVEVRVPKVVGTQKAYGTSDSPVQQVRTESLPARYNDATELRIEVQPGQNEHNFELTTK